MDARNGRRERRWLRGVAASSVLLCTSLARAQSASDKVAAETLFEEGRKLVNQGQYVAGCRKLAESQRLDPGTGTLLNLADCYERAGRTATAWATWREAAAAARSSGQTEREQLAREHATALEAKLVRLAIDVADTNRVPGLTISRDDAPVSEALWGSSVPVDPGRVVVRASAPGYQAWSTEVQIAADRPETRVSVPALSSLGAAPPVGTVPGQSVPGQSTDAVPGASPPGGTVPGGAVPGTADSGTPGSGRRVLGIVAVSLGGVGVAVGSYFGLKAKSKYSDSKVYCTTSINVCQPQGVQLRNEAISAGNLATVGFALGGVALVGGIDLIATASSSKAPPAALEWRGVAADATAVDGGGLVRLQGEF
jgi:serine/threonine-protein kinase